MPYPALNGEDFILLRVKIVKTLIHFHLSLSGIICWPGTEALLYYLKKNKKFTLRTLKYLADPKGTNLIWVSKELGKKKSGTSIILESRVLYFYFFLFTCFILSPVHQSAFSVSSHEDPLAVLDDSQVNVQLSSTLSSLAEMIWRVDLIGQWPLINCLSPHPALVYITVIKSVWNHLVYSM